MWYYLHVREARRGGEAQRREEQQRGASVDEQASEAPEASSTFSRTVWRLYGGLKV
jgi:hypothetical protein